MALLKIAVKNGHILRVAYCLTLKQWVIFIIFKKVAYRNIL